MKLSCVQRSWPRLNSSVNWYGIFILIFSLLQVSATGVHLASTFFSLGFGPHPALDGEIFWNMFSSCKHSIKSRPFVLSDFLIEFLLEQNYLAGFFWISTHFQLFSFSYHPVQQAHKNDFFVVIFMLFFIIFVTGTYSMKLWHVCLRVYICRNVWSPLSWTGRRG